MERKKSEGEENKEEPLKEFFKMNEASPAFEDEKGHLSPNV